MKIQRRHFLKLGLLQAVALGAASQGRSQISQTSAPHTGPSILQGATDDTRTQFSIVHEGSLDIEFLVTDSAGNQWHPDDIRRISSPPHPKVISKVFFSNLNPQDTYYLHLMDRQSQTRLDLREFQTLDLNKPSLRFAFCSCMNEAHHAPAIWNNMVRNRPDVLFFIGDSVYADTGAGEGGATPSHLWKRFCEARMTLEIYYSQRLVPIFATWDDHDFGRNDANSENYRYVRESQTNFLNFFAQDPSHCQILERGPGVSSALRLRNQLFILFDDRSFRLASGSKDRYAHWGAEQEGWALERVRRHDGPTWLINGSQFFPSMPFKESLSQDHPVQLAGLRKELRECASRVVFVSGDVHYSEISRLERELLGYETLELTSSSIHSTTLPGVPTLVPNGRRMASTGKRNYLMVEARAQGHSHAFKVTSYAGNNSVNFVMHATV